MSSPFGNTDPTRRRSPFGLRFVPILMGLAMIGIMAISNCQEGPFGRNQVVALNPEQEKALGLQAFQEVLAQEKRLTRGPLVDAIRTIAVNLQHAAEDGGFLSSAQLKQQPMEWRVEVVESDQQNAFCLPGGKIVVYTGILPIAETDAGLATVLGHEISHALAHHGAERMAQQQMVQIGLMSAGGAAADMSPEDRMRIMQALNAGAKFGILRYSRKHESEADHLGLLLMATAGYDPRESMKFWERMKHVGGGSPPEFLSTHPSHETRISDLNGWMPVAIQLYDKSPHKQPTKALPKADFSGAMVP
ncbi:MAG: M48 family metallopeptidase [Planctomycetia bacterium]|nr:M48 family metallopeptidase [Planctomycetia bacterium]